MRRFAKLIDQLDSTTKTKERINALVRYFEDASDKDKVWCIALLTHRRPKRPVKTPLLHEWAAEAADLPLWLFEDTYHIVGDLAETIALILPAPESDSGVGLSARLKQLIELKDKEEEEKKTYILDSWKAMGRSERFAFNKLITGGFRIGVSAKNLTKALAIYLDRPEDEIAHRLMGNWDPATTTFYDLVINEDATDKAAKPYPFYLAYPLEAEPETLGEPKDWIIEDKWDGIRGQIIRREKALFVWSRGEELVTDKYPEFDSFLESVPDGTVLDGEILCHDGKTPLPFGTLQTRIGRKTVSKKTLKDAPVKLVCYDLLEYKGEDLREVAQSKRRELLEEVVKEANDPCLLISPMLQAESWEEFASIRSTSRERYSEGLMLKRKDATYKVGRKKGDWWKWKIDPLTVDAVLIYAMRGHGRRANLYTDYTFAAWEGDKLVPFTKCYSGLTDKEFKEVDAFVKKNTLERFGPVRSVQPELVFEIAFEGIRASSRHKSGLALRFPRMARWRKDKPSSEANTLEDLRKLLELYG